MSPLSTITIEDGETGQLYTVDVKYVELAEPYGHDADGRQGTVLCSREIIRTYAGHGVPEVVLTEACERVLRGER